MSPAAHASTMATARTRPRSILLAALLFIAAGSALYVVGPWILPVRITEGPLLQDASQNAVTVIWYTSRPVVAGTCTVHVTEGDTERAVPAEAVQSRNRVRIDGLAAGQAYPYRILAGSRVLAEATLHTNKPAGEPFSFVVFGDSGQGTTGQYQLAAQMSAPECRPDFILHTGDLIYGSGQREHYQDRFFAPYRRLLPEVAFWPALGNHDVKTEDGQPFCDVFELPENGPAGVPPEHNYWFDYGSARIVVIDSNLNADILRQHVAPWLRKVLSDCDAHWKFVALHHPPYTAGAHQPDIDIQRTIVPVCEAVGVDLMFNGHDHMYERTYPLRGGQVSDDGLVYIVTGAGGAALYDARPPAPDSPSYVAVLKNQRHSFTYVQVNGDVLHLRQIDETGAVIDDWTLQKPAASLPQPASHVP